nr:hypothetical protein BaRGS_006994 [Batillaria attramentaria]
MQLAACSAFLQILQDQLVPIQNYTQTFLQTILSCVDSKDPDVAAAWLDTLLDVIDLLPKDIIKKDILSIAINKGQLSQPVQARLSCCKILGKVATKFESFVIKKEILPVVQQLCQDVEHEVRACMCNQLDAVARGLGLEATKSAILPELVELTNDEESDVRVMGIDTVVDLSSMLDDGNLTDEQLHWFVDYYKKLCKVGLPDKQKGNESKQVAKLLGHNVSAIFNDLITLLKDENAEEEMMTSFACLGKVCPNDLLYTRVIPILLNKMKHGAFFKEHLFEYVLSLTSDPVPNIRMRTCALLPDLKRLIRLPYDNSLKGSLEQCIRKILVNEKDKDVSFVMKQAVEELDQIPVQMESMVSRRKNYEDDAEDQVKEEEERNLIEREEREKREEEARAKKNSKKDSLIPKPPMPFELFLVQTVPLLVHQ